MSYSSPLLFDGSVTSLPIDWTDARAVNEHEGTIRDMANLWSLYDDDIRGWMMLRDSAEKAGNMEGMRDYAMRAAHSVWVRKVLLARMKFKASGLDPYPNTLIFSFSTPKSERERQWPATLEREPSG
jgi:hypothetical protein